MLWTKTAGRGLASGSEGGAGLSRAVQQRGVAVVGAE